SDCAPGYPQPDEPDLARAHQREWSARVAAQGRVAGAERDPASSLRRRAGAGHGHAEEQIVTGVARPRAAVLSHAAERRGQYRRAGQEPLREPRLHGIAAKRLERKQTTF